LRLRRSLAISEELLGPVALAGRSPSGGAARCRRGWC